MSYCTIIITKKSETELIKKEISKNHIEFSRYFAFLISTKYYSQKDFKNISQIFNNFSEYDLVCIEDYFSSFAQKTIDRLKYEQVAEKMEKFKKQGWSENKIQEYGERENKKIESISQAIQKKIGEIEKVLFGLANNYCISFVYYQQEREWSGFKEMKKIVESQGYYEENTVYMIDEKIYKKLLNAVSYSLGNL